jgi:hypothetical protein
MYTKRIFAPAIVIVVAWLVTSSAAVMAQSATDITSHANELTGTTLTANVYEQCDITVPATITFNVGDISDPTPSTTAASLAVTNVVTATSTKRLRVSVRASSANFTASVTGAPTWAASAVTWDAATSWAGGTGQAGTLSQSSYTPVVIGNADTAAFSTTTLHFTLAANTGVKRSGGYVLALSWKVESMDGGDGDGH